MVDLAIPCTITGVDQRAIWEGEADHARDHAIVEFHP